MNKEKALKNQGLEFREDISTGGGVATLSLWEFALCQKNSLSERSEFEFFWHGFSKFPKA